MSACLGLSCCISVSLLLYPSIVCTVQCIYLLSFCMSLCLCLSLSVSHSGSACVCFSLFVFLCRSVFACTSFSVWISLSFEYRCTSLHVSFCLSIYIICLSLYKSLCLSVKLSGFGTFLAYSGPSLMMTVRYYVRIMRHVGAIRTLLG